MSKGRLEAFSDGVIAVIITIMVLELKAPHGNDLHALATLWPVFLSYVLSFVYVGIYWNNHHHIMRAVDIIDGRVMWANLHLLFWLSLIPFATAWLGDNLGSAIPTAAYGILLFLSAAAFGILTTFLVRCNGKDSTIARAVGDDRKGRVSMLLYVLATIFSFYFPVFAYALYFVVATIWFVPDRRVERALQGGAHRDLHVGDEQKLVLRRRCWLTSDKDPDTTERKFGALFLLEAPANRSTRVLRRQHHPVSTRHSIEQRCLLESQHTHAAQSPDKRTKAFRSDSLQIDRGPQARGRKRRRQRGYAVHRIEPTGDDDSEADRIGQWRVPHAGAVPALPQLEW